MSKDIKLISIDSNQIKWFYPGQQYKGILNCLKQSVASEGYSCLFRGVGSTVIRAFPTNAATMGVVTWIMKTFSEDYEVSKNSARGLYVPNNVIYYPFYLYNHLPMYEKNLARRSGENHWSFSYCTLICTFCRKNDCTGYVSESSLAKGYVFFSKKKTNIFLWCQIDF